MIPGIILDSISHFLRERKFLRRFLSSNQSRGSSYLASWLILANAGGIYWCQYLFFFFFFYDLWIVFHIPFNMCSSCDLSLAVTWPWRRISKMDSYTKAFQRTHAKKKVISTVFVTIPSDSVRVATASLTIFHRCQSDATTSTTKVIHVRDETEVDFSGKRFSLY